MPPTGLPTGGVVVKTAGGGLVVPTGLPTGFVTTVRVGPVDGLIGVGEVTGADGWMRGSGVSVGFCPTASAPVRSEKVIISRDTMATRLMIKSPLRSAIEQ
jgi:hypothetical protein